MVFSVGSLLCSVAPTDSLLVAFRMVQAVGGSMLNPVAMSIITNTFTVPYERARAIGVWGGVVGLSMALGPLVGGLLVDSVGWRSIFWLNVPIGVLALVLTRLYVPESNAPRPRRLDPVAQVLVVVLLAGLTFGIIEGPRRGWGSAVIIGCFCAAAVVAVLVLVRYELRREEPLLDPKFFASVPFSGATLIAVSGFAAMGGFLFLNSLYLQNVRGFTPLHAGLLTLPMAAASAVAAPLSGRLVGARGPRLPLLVGGAAIVASGLLLTGLTAGTSVVFLAVAYLLFGLGFGMINAPITNAAVSGMPRAQAGVAAAVASTSRQVGATLGVAVFGAVVAGVGASAFPAASHLGWWIMTGAGAAILVLGVLTTGGWAKRTAQTAFPTEIAVGETSLGG